MAGVIRVIILPIIQVTILPITLVITHQSMLTPMIINMVKEDREVLVYREIIWVVVLPVVQQEHRHVTKVQLQANQLNLLQVAHAAKIRFRAHAAVHRLFKVKQNRPVITVRYLPKEDGVRDQMQVIIPALLQ
jgi:hypothetical protein